MRDLLNTSFRRSAGFFDNLNRGHPRAGAVLLCGSQKYPASEHERRVRCRAEKVSEFGACRHAHNLATPRQTSGQNSSPPPAAKTRLMWIIERALGWAGCGARRRQRRSVKSKAAWSPARICSFSLFSPRWSRSTTQALEQPSIAIQWLPSRPATVRLEARNFWLKTATSATFPTKENPPG